MCDVGCWSVLIAATRTTWSGYRKRRVYSSGTKRNAGAILPPTRRDDPPLDLCTEPGESGQAADNQVSNSGQASSTRIDTTVPERSKPLANMPARLPVARNTLLLSGGMAALYGMVQLWAPVTPTTFEAVTGLKGFGGLGAAGLALTVAPALWVLRRTSRHPRNKSVTPGS